MAAVQTLGRPVVDGPIQGHRLSARSYGLLITGLSAALLVGFVLAVTVGSVGVRLDYTIGIIADHLGWEPVAPLWSQVHDQIIWQYRLPRAILATAIGAGLALVGGVMQALVRNPLADPYLLGVSSGAAFGAVCVLVLGSAAVGGMSLSVAAFAGAMLAMGTVYLLAQHRGQVNPGRLILAGVALAFFFQAAYSFALQKSPDPNAARAVVFWLLGSLSGARWHNIALPCAVVAVGVVILAAQYRSLNALLAGEETAVSLGINLAWLRAELFVLTAVMVGVMVAVCGAITFVGLIVPHAARMIVGSDHRRMLPVAVLLGAVFMLFVDLVARTADQPNELSPSIVTAAIGVPFFIWLLRRSNRDERLSVS